jgi:transcription elongation factor Elf1
MTEEKFVFDTVIGFTCFSCGHHSVEHLHHEMELHKPLHIGCKECKTIMMSITVTEDEVIMKDHKFDHNIYSFEVQT